MAYSNPQNGVRMAVAAVAGLQVEQIFLQHNGDSFDLDVAPGIDWAVYEAQPDLEIPQPDDEEGNPVAPLLQPQPPLRQPKPIWDWYRQQYEGLAENPPSAEAVAAWELPTPEPSAPVTDVERAAAALAARRRTREDVIFSDTAGLVATCYAWLQRECAVPGGGTDTKTASQALQAGQGLCSTQGYGLALRAWIDFAASDFYTALSSPDATRPWLEWVPAGEPKSIREAILDRVYLATYGVPRP